MKSFNILTAAVLLGSVVAEIKPIGCYGVVSEDAVLTNVTDKRNSMGFCGTLCAQTQSVAFAISSFSLCYCVDEVPAASNKVDDSKCNLGCPAYPSDNCGGMKDFMFYDSGIALSIPTASPVASSTTSSSVASSTSSSRASATRAPAETIIITPSSTPSNAGGSSKPNTAGIAAGVVIGVVVIAGIMGGLFFFMKQRKKRALEEEHRRNAEAAKPSNHINPFNDTRLDPVMAHRRMSDGSIADNQDYSRRILKVTNA